MIRLNGLLKVASVLVLDFYAVFLTFDDAAIAAAVTGAILLFVWLGGYLALFKEGGVRCEQLPAADRARLEAAKAQLSEDVSRVSSASISGLRLYLIPGDDTLQATAYGFGCVSVTRGTLDNTDPVTLNAVLAHEVSHILNYDPELSRALLGSIVLLMAAIGVASAAMAVVLFVLFLLLGAFRSFFGVVAFRGTSKVSGGFFRLLQKAVVVIYQTLTAFVSRRAEYRCDRYAYELGYGLQLSHFLSLLSGGDSPSMTISAALYRSHPPTEKRIARIEEYISA